MTKPVAEPKRASDGPVGLTVHAQPTPEAMAADAARRTRLGRWKMVLLALVCAAPVVVSYYTYYVIRPQGQKSYGTLIEPQRPLPALMARDRSGADVALPDLKGQWLLISVSGGACDAGCENHLYLQRQIREALGKEKTRLDWVWLVDDDQAIAASLAPALRDAVVLRAPKEGMSAWLEPAPGHRLADHLYLVDPMGHWMMRFPAGLDKDSAARVRGDLGRLLHAASGWDEAGRPSEPSR